VKALDGLIERLDRYQRAHGWLGFPLAVAKKFGEDQAGNLAALVAYYAFFSLFPLLMVFTAVLGFVLRNNPDLQRTILDSALAQFPVIGKQIQENKGTIQGSGLALVVGSLTALWAGMGVTNALQNAMNSIWDVPMKERPNFLIARLRGILMLVVLGLLTVGAAILSGLGSVEGRFGGVLRVAGILGGVGLNLVLFMLAFKILTKRKVSWGDVFPGAAVAALGWAGLQLVGSYYVSRQQAHAINTYGDFAFVIGLLVWLYLGAQLTLYAAEINVVRARRLWPRGLRPKPMTEADERTLRQFAKVEERRQDEEVDVDFDPNAAAEEPSKNDAKAPADDQEADPQQAMERARSALADAREAVDEARTVVERGPRSEPR
jgi:YihY family inner membrane protein